MNPECSACNKLPNDWAYPIELFIELSQMETLHIIGLGDRYA